MDNTAEFVTNINMYTERLMKASGILLTADGDVNIAIVSLEDVSYTESFIRWTVDDTQQLKHIVASEFPGVDLPYSVMETEQVDEYTVPPFLIYNHSQWSNLMNNSWLNHTGLFVMYEIK